VPVERVCSGRGIQNILEFISNAKVEITPKEIVERALAKKDPNCEKALKLFAKILGAEAGNLCMSAMGTKGIYISGGAVQDICEYLKTEESGFLQAFYHKESLVDLMKKVPLYFVEDANNLKGAEYYSTIMD
jgi:glucokinase